MQNERVARHLTVLALILTAPMSAASSAPPLGAQQSPGARPGTPPGSVADAERVSFNLVRSREDPERFNLIVSDSEEHVVSGVFSVEQLKVFRLIMDEAKSFALTDESAGTSRPLTTRFSTKDEPSFFVDVTKLGKQSQFFITVTNETGAITLNAGAISRADVKEQGLFFEIMSRVNQAITKASQARSR